MRAVLLAIVLAGCASSSQGPVGELRFKNAPPVWAVDDQRPLKEAPDKRDYNRTLYHADGYAFKRVTRAMELRADVRAKDVNALDEVPDSTWFENRIGVRDYTIEELTRAANVDDSPFDHRPWTITGAKIGGMSVGFTFEDAKKRKYILKFDEAHAPELETGAHAIVHRILWACGFHVPQDHVGYIEVKDLVIGKKARAKGLDENKLEAALKLVFNENGKIRVLASEFVPGKPIGPYARDGKRGDDPNDRISHEERRSLRGQYSIFSWLNHTDLQEDNTIDSFDPNGYVMHYLIDFGKALGVMGAVNNANYPGYQHRFDVDAAASNLFTFGLKKQPWDGLRQPKIRGVGLYDAEHYNPGSWKPSSMYYPLLAADRHDAFWGAKILMRFKPHELAAIVKEAKYSDPQATAYMTKMLILRQRATARYWFDRVAPLDQFAVESREQGARLCFTDLTLSYKLRETPTKYVLDTYNHDGKATGHGQTLGATPDGRVCTDVPLVVGDNGYTIVRLRVQRNKSEMPPVVVHLARDASGMARVIGLRRR
jgi:hypothetical protein